MKIPLKGFILLMVCLGVNALADQAQITDHTVQAALEPLSITCEWDEVHRAYKIALSLSEATITPSLQSNHHELFSTGPEGIGTFGSNNQCVLSVRDIHRRYPTGSKFDIRQTLQVSWESGCLNDRCPSKKTVQESIIGNFDGRIFSSDRWQ